MPSSTLTAALLLSVATLQAEVRTWTNTKNQTAEGELITATESEAIIQFSGRSASTAVALNTLSEADQDYVKEWIRNDGEVTSKGSTSGEDYNPDAGYGERLRSLERLTAEIPDNFDHEWPKLIKTPEGVSVDLVRQDPEKKEWVYHSDHYEFVCDVELKSHLVERFAILFEGTREMMRQLPISSKKAHVAGKTHRNRIILCESEETYFRNGGPPGSAGVYMGGSDVVMVPLTSLGVKKVGSSYSVDYGESNKTLPHELAHQLTDHEYYKSGARGWFSEGLAEYVGVTPYRSGNFMVTKTLNAARDYATEYGRKGEGGRALGDEISAPALKDYMLQSYGSFTANANFNYGLGLLVTAYFFEMEGGGDRVAITAFLKALREGKEGEEALQALLQGRTYAELAQDISDGWRSKGIDIEFAEED
ncbi:hypothetical protein [Roseibacillus ishigakijimensis]|uniref:Peptidase MA superfamily protein n=1 Tax=Roseibacillus ishigakijimensis TaxID=454146 RepID=A0A934VNZ8_9BACT|nr:hypothetical protein [Roseibacillus ishigakijimensis]MBK1835565.1 hypothetical protein [Roseibacillus ishigakijimensis]